MAKGWHANRSSKCAQDAFILVLLVFLFHLLKKVEKGELYMSHILSKNKTDDGDLDVTMSMSES